MRIVRCLSIIVLSLIVLSSCSKEEIEELQIMRMQSNIQFIEEEIMSLVNEYRAEEGLSQLEFDQSAYEYAEEHNNYMISEGRISHDDFNRRSSDLALATGSGFVAENVGRNFITAKALVEAWKKSPTHQKNMLGDFTHAAVSAAPDKNGNLYFTNLFYK